MKRQSEKRIPTSRTAIKYAHMTKTLIVGVCVVYFRAKRTHRNIPLHRVTIMDAACSPFPRFIHIFPRLFVCEQKPTEKKQ